VQQGLALSNLLHVVVSGYAVVRGGAPERVAGVALLAATLATRLLQGQAAVSFAEVEWGALYIDALLLAILLFLALEADRYWPLWMAALQGLQVTAHLAKLLDIGLLRPASAVPPAVWGYPMLLLLFCGAARHHLRRERFGIERAWSRGFPS